ncbi:hypothetical protein [Nocardioides sp. TF02-7]|uniref:hypothetical protein n=1 Tax=Nocardioides sp. TF02-7 TaxID=2917724 RepID=UPI001F06E37A|nr:hypothetical protein [Nocardioides sp. TF02-7]UMG91812.1 hypothetical protein MF408_17415 [Nocardioides sp. TF02-7]
MENMIQRTAIAHPALPDAVAPSRALMPACAASVDVRTADVRTVTAVAPLPGTGVSISATVRDRGIAGTTDKRHTGYFAGVAQGSTAWSPPI